MPPWHIDRSAGVQHFTNDMSLTDAEYAERVAKCGEGVTNGGKPAANAQQQ